MKSQLGCSPLQLSSCDLTAKHILPFKPLLAPKPSLRTETLERHPSRSSQLNTFTSGRCSAEPLEYFVRGQHVRPDQMQLATSLSELDLRNIDPDMAARLLDQIESGGSIILCIEIRHDQLGTFPTSLMGTFRLHKMGTHSISCLNRLFLAVLYCKPVFERNSIPTH